MSFLRTLFSSVQKKCEVYWSPLDDASTFGPFTVSTVSASYEIIIISARVTRLTSNGIVQALWDWVGSLFLLRTKKVKNPSLAHSAVTAASEEVLGLKFRCVLFVLLGCRITHKRRSHCENTGSETLWCKCTVLFCVCETRVWKYSVSKIVNGNYLPEAITERLIIQKEEAKCLCVSIFLGGFFPPFSPCQFRLTSQLSPIVQQPPKRNTWFLWDTCSQPSVCFQSAALAASQFSVAPGVTKLNSVFF